ncbi:EmrB/QacA subfamily drug resistance transporter [Arcticibacter pallidicorallinus]|uniref:EmrB/QacA subfamily drug resistance transporter n=1 Tax=Arcticibacter pallidicorallinus TaxID=1259464 RepID=A0A2T0U4G3_9SPHI|nr:MDR family MFS transporter [Arcticibacter pallidicorallinus]PRY52823.1 EmrB/QacA subfamily drug resistance transporter [Arcticibacter pallidicorallinus]
MDQNRLLTFVGILLALFLGAIDQTIVTTALPRIVQDLHGLERYTWVASSYLVASTVLVPVYGKLADMYSRKKIELISIGIFLTGSFLCGLAGEFGSLPLLGDGMSQLIIFRAIQGFGGAGLFSMAFIIIADLFPASVRGKYQGYVGAVFGLASVLGPWIGGLLTDHGGSIIPGIAGWRWVFYVNIPFGAIALWFIVAKMPPLLPKVQVKQKLDYLSAVFLLLGLVPLMIGLQLDKTVHPWTSTINLALFGAAALSLILFYFRSLRSDNPILNLKLFSDKVFSRANAATFMMGACFMGIVVFLPLFMVNVVGVSATRAGVSMVPLSMGMFVGSIVSGQLVSRFGNYKVFLLGGIAILLVGLYLLSGMTTSTGFNHVLFYTLICGLGLGPTTPLFTLAIQNSVPIQSLGQATSANQFFRQMGSVIGIAIMGSLMSATLSGVAPTRIQFANAITHNYSLIIFIAIAAFAITLFVPQKPLKKTHGFVPAPVEPDAS